MLIDILGPPRLWCQTNIWREREALEDSSMELIPCYFHFSYFSPFCATYCCVLRLSPKPIYTLKFDSCKFNFSFSFLLRMLVEQEKILTFRSLFFPFYSETYQLTDHLKFGFHFAITHTPKPEKAGVINGIMQATHSKCKLIIGCALSPNWFQFLFRSQLFAR